ncbi:MAG: SpoIIE family protein phosphatase [Phycisphaeraceae bacterium]|nr:SpoIIE family protein phosphatase [Phycisphaeraceae bacterium]
MPAAPEQITLRTLTGPDAAVFVLPSDRASHIGRLAESDICLLNDAVSRRHATISRRNDGWYIVHIGSRSLTFLNGVQLERESPAVLDNGDLIRIGPWTFMVRFGVDTSRPDATVDDAPSGMMRVERAAVHLGSRSDQRLRLLTACIARLNEAVDERLLSEAALDAALAGSGYTRGGVLRALDSDGDVEVVATTRTTAGDTTEFQFSRSLIRRAAAEGTVALFEGGTPLTSATYGSSIAELQIHSALCTPVLMGDTLAGFLYLDARGEESRVRTDAAGFCEAIATAYGMSLAALKRAELERRQRELMAELTSARDAQQFILPAAFGQVGVVRYAMEMRPGLFVAGDLFDVIALGDGRVGVSFGDVAGHGAGSAMLMASTQSYLNAELRSAGDPARAMNALNRYLCDHSVHGRFVSLWLGVFSSDGSLEYVDGGHGHWMHVRGSEPLVLDGATSNTGIPVGIDPRFAYRASSLTLRPSDRIIAYSDGVLDQRSTMGERFGKDRVLAALSTTKSAEEDIASIFADLTRWANGAILDDDATVASIEFEGIRR